MSGDLVAPPAFKAGGTGDPCPAGSIPVHLRHDVVGRRREVRTISPMIGRDREREVLRRALDDLADGAGVPALLLEGAVGVGKTTLLDDAAEHAALPVRRAAAYELEQGRPFGVIVDVLGRQAPPISVADHPDPTSAEARFAVVDALVGELDALADGHPMVVVVDDLQWCDVGSAMVLDRLVRRRDRFGIGILVASRLHAAPPALARSIREDGAVLTIGDLPEEDAMALACERLGATRLGPVLTDLTRAATGHPLSLVELTRHLQANGAVAVRAKRAEVLRDCFPDLAGDLLSRLPALGEGAREVLRAVAVLGPRSSVAEIVDLTARSAPDVAAVLEQLVASGHLRRSAEGIRFRHDLLRRALLDSLAPDVAEELHRDAAWRLHAAGADLLRVAAHLRRGARRGEHAAITVLTDAAASVATQDPSEAVALLDRALELEADPARRDVIEVRSLWPLIWSGRGREAAERAASLLRRQRDPASSVEVRIAAAAAAHVLGHREEVLLHTEVDESVAGAPAERLLQLRAEGADALVLLRDLEDAEGSVVALAREAETAENWSAATLAWGAAAQARGMRGWFPEAADHALQAVRCGDRTTEGRRRNKRHLLGVFLHHCDRSSEGERVLHDGLEENERLGVVWSTTTHHLFLAGICFDTGRIDDAEAHLEAAVAAADDTDGRLNRADVRLLQSTFATHRGDLRAAERLLETHEGQPSTAVVQATTRLTYLDALGDDQALREALLRFAPPAASIGWARAFGPPVVRMFLRCGLEERARTILPVLDTVVERSGTASAEASRLRVRGLLTAHAEPVVHAVELLRTTARIGEVGDACEDAADLLPVQDPRRVPLLQEAHAAAVTAGRGLAVRRRADALRRIGVTPSSPVPDAASGGWTSLTPAERRVVALVAEGLTYRAVAERLHLSRRTVESHVAHVFQKLGVRSREQLSQIARRRG